MADERANLITDVPGIKVGNAHEPRVKTGVTVVLPDAPAVAAVDVRGGAPGTRETDLLAPEQMIEHIHGIVLSGGSAFGLEAASGVHCWLAQEGRGFDVGGTCVPIVPAAIVFDLQNGGDKNWGMAPPYRDLGLKAGQQAGDHFAIGSVGAGFGATTACLKGGLGSASERLTSGVSVGALVVVNALGSATIGDTPHFWAAPFEQDGEFGGLGLPSRFEPSHVAVCLKPLGNPDTLNASDARAPTHTTIAVIASDAILSKPQAKRLAIMAHDGLARALYPVHTPLDGDLVFVLATGHRALADPVVDLIDLGTSAANCLTRAIARGVYAATPAPGDRLPAYSVRFAEK